MNPPILIPLPGNEHLAAGIAGAIDAEIGMLEMHQFPDGETYLRFNLAAPRAQIEAAMARLQAAFA